MKSLQKGFTLIELIVVIVLVGILASIGGIFISRPIEGYVALSRRAELVDSADTALRLARFFSVEPQLWMNLQAQYDLEMAERKLAKVANLEIVPLKNAA